MRRSFFLSWLVHLVVGIAEIILALRIVLRLFDANPVTPFVHWVYSTSSTLLFPFRGIFPSGVLGRGYVLDFTALFALIIYAIVGSFLIFVIRQLEASLNEPTVNTKHK